MMDQAVSSAEANRRFSIILREVRDGASYVVTAHGRPVARIVPFSADDTARVKARIALQERLRNQPVTDVGLWERDDLYER